MTAGASASDVSTATINPESSVSFPGALTVRDLPDGRVVCVYPMTTTFALCIDCNEYGYSDRYCYKRSELALHAAETWDGTGDPPLGWVRHVNSGRRRPHGGGPDEEFINP